MPSLQPTVHPCLTMAPAELWIRESQDDFLRAALWRDLSNHDLSSSDRLTRWPLLLTCRLTWVIKGWHRAIPSSESTHVATDAGLLPRIYVSGPFSHPSEILCSEQSQSLTLMLYPDAMVSELGVDMEAVFNRHVAAEQVLSGDWLKWVECVLYEPDHELRKSAIDVQFSKRKPSNDSGSWEVRRNDSFSSWVTRLRQHADQLHDGGSRRQWERVIRRLTGQSLRGLISLARAEKAFFIATQEMWQGDLNWRHVAQSAGYSDQSHLGRETLKVSGFTPEGLKKGMLTQESFWVYRTWATMLQQKRLD